MAETKRIEWHRTHPYLALGLIAIGFIFVLLLTCLALAYEKAEMVLPVLTGIVGLVGGAIWVRAVTSTHRADP
jgi:hypothetical protein